MDKEIKQEIKRLMREGFTEQMAIITACANSGKPELASDHIEELNDEQDTIKYALEKMGMIPYSEAYPDIKIPSLYVDTKFDGSYNLIKNEITITYDEIEPEPEDKKANDALNALDEPIDEPIDELKPIEYIIVKNRLVVKK